MLRHDNADLRLTEIGYKVGLISEERYERFLRKKEAIEKGLILHNIFCQYYKFYNGDISETMNITLQKMNISNDFQQIYKNHIK